MKPRSIVVTALVAFVFSGCAGKRTPEVPMPSERLIAADAALKERRFREANALFESATREPNEAFYGWVGLGLAADAEGRRDAFDAAASAAMALDPGAPETRDLLGRMLLKGAVRRSPPDRRLAATAFSYFRRAAQDEPDLPNLRYHAGVAASILGDENFAEAAFEAAVLAEPESEPPRRALAVLRARRSGATTPSTSGPAAATKVEEPSASPRATP
jgi:hypothetical protein